MKRRANDDKPESRVRDAVVPGSTLQALIRLADRWMREKAEARSGRGMHAANERLATLRTADLTELEIALREMGVTAFRMSQDEFDPKRQECVTTRPADQDHAAGLIARRLWPGYKQNDRVLVRERVVVFANLDDSQQQEK